MPDVVEDAETFEGNAAKKARAFALATGAWALSDDSGLCVDALGGRPGVHSARYAEGAARIPKLLRELEGVPRELRTARFVCVMCLAGPDGREVMARGVCEGWIGFAPRGEHGFGFDPVFELPGGKTMAELDHHQKSEISHRGKAFRELARHLDSPRL